MIMAMLNTRWPVVKTYDSDHLRRIALPLGGIGTGTVSLGGRGDLRDWETVNRPAKGFVPSFEDGKVGPFFALWAKAPGAPGVTRCLEHWIAPEDYEGAAGCVVPNAGMPRFRNASFSAAYPLAQLNLSDPDVPIEVRLEAFNPLVPGDADASGLPIAVLRYVLINRSSKPVKAAVCGSVPNFIGQDGSTDVMKDNVIRFRKNREFRGLFFESNGVCECAETFGTMALATTATDVTYWTNWPKGPTQWLAYYQAFWDDFGDDGKLCANRPGTTRPQGFLSASVAVPAKSEKAITFVLGWCFPNRMTWTPLNETQCDAIGCCDDEDPNNVGNYYTTQFADAWDVLRKTMPKLKDLESKTVEFVSSVVNTDLPGTVTEAALFNLSTLRTQTCFRTRDGLFHGWEGCNDTQGCCCGTCTHVWNYEQATAFLFGDLSRKLRVLEFEHGTQKNGLMHFRIGLPLEHQKHLHGVAAADGQMGCIMKMYRDWQLSGDDALLVELWPKVKKSLEFCWIKGGWDADGDGVMEGAQHNTMDVEYFGPNAQMGVWYLGALRAAEEMAGYLGEVTFAEKCRALFENGSTWLDANLFNGLYYEHDVRPPKHRKDVAKGLLSIMGSDDVTKPDFQLGKACLVDQLVGQYMAHICGLGYLVKPTNVRKTLASIHKHNFKRSFEDHFVNVRTFVLNDESATVMASYPLGNRPTFPFPYWEEVMTGFEYTAAVGMLQEGMTRKGLELIDAVRERYDGKRRNPFDEAECGHHYARAMTSWAALLELTGFFYSGVDGGMLFRPVEKGAATWFWSNGNAWGTVTQQRKRDTISVALKVLHGEIEIREFGLRGWALKRVTPRTLTEGRSLRVTLNRE
jgi:non-lysosomal glucosylceramidase